MKKALLILLAVCTVLMCSCSGVGTDISDSLTPPKPSGELYDIQKALEAYAGSKVHLVYPSSGAYRSAIITKDINSDGEYEVFAFYSTKTDDNTTVMHLNYIMHSGGKWKSVTDIQVDCSGVESVEFMRLDESATPKVIVNWNRFSGLNKQLSVYSIDLGVLTEITSVPVSEYSACDFEGDGTNDLLGIYLDAEKKSAQATLWELDGGSLNVKSTCRIDGTVTSYYSPSISKLPDGTPAMFIDADKATGIITEVLYVRGGALISAFSSPDTGENTRTLRVSEVRADDFDGDGRIDIPLSVKLPLIPGKTETDSVYMTTWNSFDGNVFTPIKSTVINYRDGYQMVIPEEWKNNFTVDRRTDERQRIMYRWDGENAELGEEILRIQAVKVSDWEKKRSSFEEYEEIMRSDEFVYAVKFSNSALTPELATVKENFSILNSKLWRGNR